MGLSCLVISRTPAFLNRMLASLQAARAFWHPCDEVLCSWNGSAVAETEIQPPSGGPAFRIVQRQPYHFASNINAMARQAHGEWLVLLNDDLILDPSSIDHALQILAQQPDVGVLGARLRCSNGRLGHAGLLFSNDGRPYNRLRPDLGSRINPNGPEALESGPIPAVTGAFMVLRTTDFQAVGGLRESFRVCGEDIALCLDLWQQLGKTPYYAGDVSGIHDEKSTRGDSPDHHDVMAVGQLAAPLCRSDTAFQARQSRWALQEAELLYSLIQAQACEADQRQMAWEARQQHWDHVRKVLQAKIEVLNLMRGALMRSSSWVITRPWRALGLALKARKHEPGQRG